jgi:hypothetical protein
MARKGKNYNVSLTWVVVRDQDRKIVNARSFTDHKEALYFKDEMDEAPNPEGKICTVEIEHYIPPDSPYKH